MTIEQFVDLIRNLSKPGKGFKPHKPVAILTVISLTREGKIAGNRIYFNVDFRRRFAALMARYGTDEDSNRPHTPFFHLATSGFWNLIPREGKATQLAETSTIGSAGELTDLVEYAELDPAVVSLLDHERVRVEVEDAIAAIIAQGIDSRSVPAGDRVKEALLLSSVEPIRRNADSACRNPFIAYLNSLQNCQAGNENSLAEFQASSRFFSMIHVRHPLVNYIHDMILNSEPTEHIILTGHAGDGKTTIAFDLCKSLRGLPTDKYPGCGIERREELLSSRLTVIKDLSEWGQRDRETLFSEVLLSQQRFLIVSNTGTLLDLFRAHAEATDGSAIRIESILLEAISDAIPSKTINYAGSQFRVINLALLDNLALARQIFTRMLAPEQWNACSGQECAMRCPILQNVTLMQNHLDRVACRLFLAYRRMYEYGTRLTLRQVSAHLAYLVTSGLDCDGIQQLVQASDHLLSSEFMFFNRFFGDTGKTDDSNAAQLPAVREIRRQGFGLRLCPTWERRLWWKSHGEDFHLGISECDAEFDRLRTCGAGERIDASGLNPDQAREQVRRMLFFLYDFDPKDTSFLSHYLGSPSLMTWLGWQKPCARLSVDERCAYMQRVYHVLQEQFTGTRLPEGLGPVDRLYITLSRRKREIRQSAQVVLAQVDWSTEVDLSLVPRRDALGSERTDLELIGLRRAAGAVLRLSLPFLDYVISRHYGEMSAILQAAYVERLERFKTELLQRTREERNDVLLVRLRTDNKFSRQRYSMSDTFLEVADV